MNTSADTGTDRSVLDVPAVEHRAIRTPTCARSSTWREWSERAGCKGILVYSDNSQLDAWTGVARHPPAHGRAVSARRGAADLHAPVHGGQDASPRSRRLSQRQVYLNMVAGGFKNDLVALNDTTPHDRRYDRLVRIHAASSGACSRPIARSRFERRVLRGRQAEDDAGARPRAASRASSSRARRTPGVAAARAIGATAIKYPKPAGEEEPSPWTDLHCGIRVGIIARPDAERGVGCRARTLSGRSQGTDHPAAGDQGLGLGLAPAAHRSRPSATDSPYWLVPFQQLQDHVPVSRRQLRAGRRRDGALRGAAATGPSSSTCLPTPKSSSTPSPPSPWRSNRRCSDGAHFSRTP